MIVTTTIPEKVENRVVSPANMMMRKKNLLAQIDAINAEIAALDNLIYQCVQLGIVANKNAPAARQEESVLS